MRELGAIPPTLFWDHLKDERRPPEKLRKEGGTRVFSLCDLAFLLEYRRMNMDFDTAFIQHSMDVGCAVGIAVDGPQWTHLATSLLSQSNNIIAIDYSNFGPGLDVELAYDLEMIRADWYKKYTGRDERKVRDIMTREIVNPLHLVQNTIYQTVCGIPSGHPSTTILNSMVNRAQLVIAWLSLAPPELKNVVSFREHVTAYCYGDDSIIAVSDAALAFFNGLTLQSFFAQYGIKVTSSLKTEAMQEKVSLTEATFLKRGFLPHPTRPQHFLAPIDPVSYKDCAHFIRRSPSKHGATQDNLDQSLRLCYGHGPEAFNKWKETLNDSIKYVPGLKPLMLQWNELDFSFFG
jgi:hypothetical protein